MTFLQLKRRFLQGRRLIQAYRGRTGQTYVWDRVEEYRKIWSRCADALGGSFYELEKDLWEVRLGDGKVRISNDKLPFDDPVTLDTAGRKPVVYRLLAAQGLPVPDFLCFGLSELGGAWGFVHLHPDGCVVKPANGTSSGQGVTTHVRTYSQLRDASLLASLFCSEIMIEPMIPGESYRVLVLEGSSIHAVCRRGPRLIGDGVSTIAALISSENKRRRRHGSEPWPLDEGCAFTLRYQGLTFESKPPRGAEVVINSTNDPRRRRSELRTIYNASVLPEIHPSILRQAETAAEVLGSRFVGVDFICPTAAIPLQESGGSFNELNTTPGLHHHYDPEGEPFPKPALEALRVLLAYERPPVRGENTKGHRSPEPEGTS